MEFQTINAMPIVYEVDSFGTNCVVSIWAFVSYSCMYKGHFFNMATIQEETTMKKNHEKGTFINCHEHV